MKVLVALAIACTSLGAARAARELAIEQRDREVVSEPFAPSPGAAPFLSLGYRELLADLLFVRLTGHFGDEKPLADAVIALAEAITTIDPYFKRVYDYGARATMIVAPPDRQLPYARRAVALYEAGARRFPGEYKFPLEAGQMYLFDMKSDDPAEQRAWEERGIRLVEKAMHMPGAPASRATYVAELRSRLGQHQRAVDGLREMLLITTDKTAQETIIKKLAALQKDSAQELAAEIQLQRKRFENEWKAERWTVPQSWYVLLGPQLPRTFDMVELATGGKDLADSLVIERLEPVPD